MEVVNKAKMFLVPPIHHFYIYARQPSKATFYCIQLLPLLLFS